MLFDHLESIFIMNRIKSFNINASQQSYLTTKLLANFIYVPLINPSLYFSTLFFNFKYFLSKYVC